VAFIGYLVGGPAGATLAAIGVFLPSFLIVVLAAPHYRRIAGKGRVKAFVAGVTAGAIGAIAGAVIVLGRKSIVDLPTVAIALASLNRADSGQEVPEHVLILLAGVVGRSAEGGAGMTKSQLIWVRSRSHIEPGLRSTDSKSGRDGPRAAIPAVRDASLAVSAPATALALPASAPPAVGTRHREQALVTFNDARLAPIAQFRRRGG